MVVLLLPFFLVLLIMAAGTRESFKKCSICKRTHQQLKNLPTEYDGPRFPADGKIVEGKVCTSCRDFALSWIRVGFSLHSTFLHHFPFKILYNRGFSFL